jgi:hypothetical protein
MKKKSTRRQIIYSGMAFLGFLTNLSTERIDPSEIDIFKLIK